MTTPPQELAPPSPPSALEWVRKNLFSNWLNSILTILGMTVVYFALVGIGSWVINTADWRPVTVAPLLFMIGQYPREELWRVGISVLSITFLVGMSWGVWKQYMRAFAIFLGIVFAVLSSACSVIASFSGVIASS